jgi:carboxymethylenebutenolidase
MRKLQLQTADGLVDCTEHRPAGTGPFAPVLFFMDAIGWRPAMWRMADRLAENGYLVLVPNLFYRAGDYPPFDPRTMWSDPAERTRAFGLIRSLTPGKALADAGAYLDWLEAHPDARAGGAGAVGYCMGGTLAFRAAAAFPARLRAVAAIHAGNLVTDAPDSPHLGAGRVRATCYFAVADHDRACTPEHQEVLGQALLDASVKHTLEPYAGASHGFAVDDSPVYERGAAERHWQRVLELFAETLR